MITRDEFLRRSAMAGATLGLAPEAEALGARMSQTDRSTLIVAAADTPQILDMQKTVHPPSEEVVVGGTNDVLWEFKKKKIGPGQFASDFNAPFAPRLATSWHVSKDGRTWTIKLRKGVKSAAGNEFTSADVKWTWDRIFGVKGLGIFYYNTLNMKPKDIKVIDKYTVSFTTAKPAATFLCDMQQFAAVIFDSTEAKKHATASDPWATDWLAKHAAGFGPYVIDSWTPGEQMVLSARRDYYLGTPKIHKVIYRAVPSSANRLALLLSGTVDVAEDLSAEELAKVRASKGVADLFWPRGSRFAALMMNLASKPFNDVRVRQAIAYATPYDDIVKGVYLGRARRMRTIFPSNYPYATSRFNPYHTDYEKARSLLKAAGYGKGFSTTLSYNAAVPEEERLAILMRTSLKKVGVNLSLQKLPPAVFFTKLQGKQFPFVIFLDQPICPNPGYALFLYYVTKSLVNYTYYSNKQVDRLILRGLGGSLNPKFQRRIWYEVQRRVLRDCPWVWVAEQGFHLAVRSNVRGATWYPINDIQFRDFSKS